MRSWHFELLLEGWWSGCCLVCIAVLWFSISYSQLSWEDYTYPPHRLTLAMRLAFATRNVSRNVGYIWAEALKGITSFCWSSPSFVRIPCSREGLLLQPVSRDEEDPLKRATASVNQWEVRLCCCKLLRFLGVVYCCNVNDKCQLIKILVPDLECNSKPTTCAIGFQVKCYRARKLLGDSFIQWRNIW